MAATTGVSLSDGVYTAIFRFTGSATVPDLEPVELSRVETLTTDEWTLYLPGVREVHARFFPMRVTLLCWLHHPSELCFDADFDLAAEIDPSKSTATLVRSRKGRIASMVLTVVKGTAGTTEPPSGHSRRDDVQQGESKCHDTLPTPATPASVDHKIMHDCDSLEKAFSAHMAKLQTLLVAELARRQATPRVAGAAADDDRAEDEHA